MSSKFHIELGQGTVSAEGEEEFVGAAFGALQSVLTAGQVDAGSPAEGSKFHIQLGQGTVSVDGGENFVKAAFSALQSTLSSETSVSAPVVEKSPAAAVNDPEPVKVEKTETQVAPAATETPEAPAAPEPAEKVEAKDVDSATEESFGSPGEILERIKESMSLGDDDKKEAVA